MSTSPTTSTPDPLRPEAEGPPGWRAEARDQAAEDRAQAVADRAGTADPVGVELGRRRADASSSQTEDVRDLAR